MKTVAKTAASGAGKKRGELRALVLDAALALAATSDPAQLTLDAVAAKAGVSKGGLQYHFKSKEALLTAMMVKVVENFRQSWRGAGTETATQEQLLEAYLDRSFGVKAKPDQAALALFAVAAHQPSLLQPVREDLAERTAELLAASKNPHVALILMLAADALRHYDAVGLQRFDARLRQRMHAAIIDLARQQGVIPASEPVPAKATARAAAAPRRHKKD